MKIKYAFVNGEVSEIEVSEEFAAMIVDSRHEEKLSDRMHHRHCYSLDALVYKGQEYGTEDSTTAICDGADEQSKRVASAFTHLSTTQQRRLILLADGISIREIARREGKNFRSVYDSIEAAKKKFLKFFFKTPHQSGH